MQPARWNSVRLASKVRAAEIAKRLGCVELAPALVRPGRSESASKLDALHTLRESGCQEPARRLQQERVPEG